MDMSHVRLGPPDGLSLFGHTLIRLVHQSNTTPQARALIFPKCQLDDQFKFHEDVLMRYQTASED